MGQKIEYSHGQILNDSGSIFLEEVLVEKGKPRKAWIKCGGCGKKYIAPIKKVKTGQLCSECGHKKTAQAKKIQYYPGEILNEYGSSFIAEDHRDKYGVLFIKAKCGLCGEEYIANAYKIKQGGCCSKCKGNKVSQNTILYKEGDIITSNSGVKFHFIKETTVNKKRRTGIFSIIYGDKESNTFPANLSSVLQDKANGGQGMSIGEINFYQAIYELQLPFQWQYSFSDLVAPDTNTHLKFDFAIFPNSYKDLDNIVLVELDGEQHFKPVEKFGGKEAFLRRKKLDNLKTEYAKEHNHILVRINYKDYPKIDKEYVNNILQSVYEGRY